MKRVLAFALGAVAVVALVVVAGLGWLYTQAETSNVGELEFENELDVPPLLEPTTDGEGRKVFDWPPSQRPGR